MQQIQALYNRQKTSKIVTMKTIKSFKIRGHKLFSRPLLSLFFYPQFTGCTASVRVIPEIDHKQLVLLPPCGTIEKGAWRETTGIKVEK